MCKEIGFGKNKKVTAWFCFLPSTWWVSVTCWPEWVICDAQSETIQSACWEFRQLVFSNQNILGWRGGTWKLSYLITCRNQDTWCDIAQTETDPLTSYASGFPFALWQPASYCHVTWEISRSWPPNSFWKYITAWGHDSITFYCIFQYVILETWWFMKFDIIQCLRAWILWHVLIIIDALFYSWGVGFKRWIWLHCVFYNKIASALVLMHFWQCLLQTLNNKSIISAVDVVVQACNSSSWSWDRRVTTSRSV